MRTLPYYLQFSEAHTRDSPSHQYRASQAELASTGLVWAGLSWIARLRWAGQSSPCAVLRDLSRAGLSRWNGLSRAGLSWLGWAGLKWVEKGELG